MENLEKARKITRRAVQFEINMMNSHDSHLKSNSENESSQPRTRKSLTLNSSYPFLNSPKILQNELVNSPLLKAAKLNSPYKKLDQKL